MESRISTPCGQILASMIMWSALLSLMFHPCVRRFDLVPNLGLIDYHIQYFFTRGASEATLLSTCANNLLLLLVLSNWLLVCVSSLPLIWFSFSLLLLFCCFWFGLLYTSSDNYYLSRS
jgi:hypothetical protein